jgi:hypothetical protein
MLMKSRVYVKKTSIILLSCTPAGEEQLAVGQDAFLIETSTDLKQRDVHILNKSHKIVARVSHE